MLDVLYQYGAYLTVEIMHFWAININKVGPIRVKVISCNRLEDANNIQINQPSNYQYLAGSFSTF